MRKIQLVNRIASSAARVGWRRLRLGPAQPGWSFAYECIVEALRLTLDKAVPLAERRTRLHDLGRLEAARKRVTLDDVEVGGVPATRITPFGAPTENTILYFHGGGYCVGSSFGNLVLTAPLANACRCTILSLDYRLAPEHPCPAAIEDATDAYRSLLERGVAPARIIIAGDSAGGGLSLATLLAIRDQSLPLPAAGVLLSPWVDLRLETSQSRPPQGVDYIDGEHTIILANDYAGELSLDDPRVSPILAELAGLPPLFVLAGEAEMLVGDSLELARCAAEAGVDVTLDVEPTEVHEYITFSGFNPRADRALHRVARFVALHT